MNIIANLFRDTNEPDTGLSPAVEELARAVMCRMAHNEERQPTNGHGLNMVRPHDPRGFDALRRQRMDTLLHQMAYGPITRVQAMELLGTSDGAYLSRVMQMMRDAGLMTVVRANNRTTMTITDAGRAHVTGKLAEKCGARPQIAPPRGQVGFSLVGLLGRGRDGSQAAIFRR